MILLIVLVVALAQVLMVVYFFVASKQQKQEKLPTTTKDWDLIHNAIKKSQAIVGEAELEAIKETAEARVQTGKYEDEIINITKQEMVRAGEAFKAELRKQTELIKTMSTEETKRSLEEFRGQLEKNLLDIQNNFARELGAYKTQKEKAIDQHGEEIIERAVELYLGKKLSRAEQMQLIFEALEKAKTEHDFR